MYDEEKLISWDEEAEAVINDVNKFVSTIAVSSTLEHNERYIFLNVKTLEGKDFCIELSGLGFRVVGETFNSTESSSEEYFDTPYALLSSLSPSYERNFASSLAAALSELSD